MTQGTEKARVLAHAGLGVSRDAGRDSFARAHSSTGPSRAQPPDGDLPAYYNDGLIWIAGPHVCDGRNGVLHRTFAPPRHSSRERLAFRLDVSQLAVARGTRWIAATDRRSGMQWAIEMGDFRTVGELLEHPRLGRRWTWGFGHWRQVDAAKSVATRGAL